MGPKRWQDWANAVLGLWTVVSPWLLGLDLSTSVAARPPGSWARQLLCWP